MLQYLSMAVEPDRRIPVEPSPPNLTVIPPLEEQQPHPMVVLFKRGESWVTRHVQENVLLGNPIDRPEQYDNIVIDKTLNNGNPLYPVVFNTHTAHPAGFTSMEEAAYIRSLVNPYLPPKQQINGAAMLIANTMLKGQSEDIVTGLKDTLPIFERYDTTPYPVKRRKDMKGMSDKEKQKYLWNYLNDIGEFVDTNRMLIVLPEASVESGRQRPGGVPGEIKGMIDLEPDVVSFLVRAIRRKGKEPIFFFVGTTGANRIYDPITEKKTWEAKRRALIDKIPGVRDHLEQRLGIDSLMQAVVDYPTTYKEIEEAFGQDGKMQPGIAEWYVGERLAQLIPFHERGVYQEPEILDDAPQILRRDTRPIFLK